MPRVKHHRSSRRVPPPKDSDFDHEIKLVNHTPSPPTSPQDGDSRSPSRASSAAGPSSGRQQEPPDADAAGGRIQNGDAGAQPDGHTAKGRGRSASAVSQGPVVQVEEPTPLATERPETPDKPPKPAKHKPTKPKSPESAIDILYENQRGGFLCGVPLFSSKALGNLDPPPWTNFAHKASPTDITTAQVPDPSWEWAWPEWKINHEEGVGDEDGWEYSFMFSKKFSWHKSSWWNSFVRRRAWIRKRVRKNVGYAALEGGMLLNPEYFSVRKSTDEGPPDRSSSRGGGSTTRSKRGSSFSTAGMVEEPVEDIESAGELLAVLRASRIDREKIEAVENYLEHAQDELEGLQDVMHDVMAVFVFQASRRALLSKLTDVYDKAAAECEKNKKKAVVRDGEDGEELMRRVKNLAEAVKHADEEVRKLEYWSDVKMVVSEGDSKGGVDERHGWDEGWQPGLDRSGPKAPKVESEGAVN
ncbi:hypothetical protein QBC34DRAFT_34739 [Podospora aff. communis PSN243]|uniref:Meiotically up-regulated 65 protein n=1 Tax=Podospora aff. communis PSN243 TaxID=3040156 RepID=A0AAV9GVV8_9PEZI|nr:hypothetical protein QBC34DRAFT_34739 [Podospora aff. communis PSN243]